MRLKKLKQRRKSKKEVTGETKTKGNNEKGGK
jgi:hypothetical protein